MRYLKLYWAFFKTSLAADLEFRANFVTKIVTDIFWYIAQIASFEVLYRFTDTIGGWSQGQTRVFLGVLFLVDGIYMLIFSDNLDNFTSLVKTGALDLLLAKPVNSQFMISCKRAATAYIGNIILASAWLFWALYSLEGFVWIRLLWLIIMVPAGLTIFYCFRFFFCSSAIIFVGTENLQYLWYNFYKLGTRPDNIYAPWLKYFILMVLPVGIIASAPARIILGTGSLWLVGWSVVVSGILLYLSSWLWRVTLKYYASASS